MIVLHELQTHTYQSYPLPLPPIAAAVPNMYPAGKGSVKAFSRERGFKSPRSCTSFLEPNPLHVYSKVSPIIVNRAYSQERVASLAAPLSNVSPRISASNFASASPKGERLQESETKSSVCHHSWTHRHSLPLTRKPPSLPIMSPLCPIMTSSYSLPCWLTCYSGQWGSLWCAFPLASQPCATQCTAGKDFMLLFRCQWNVCSAGSSSP